VKIKLTKRAERRIEIVDQWWRTNRLEAPELLKQERQRTPAARA